MTFPSPESLKICFAHPAYQLKAAFDQVFPNIENFEARTPEQFEDRVGEADVIVISGFWKNSLMPGAKRLQFIQSISAGTNQFDLNELKRHGVRLASGQGVNKNAVSDHAMSLVLALARRLPEARDNQAKHVWRPMQSQLSLREDELHKKVMLVIGLGHIGNRLARLAKAFEMDVIGVRQHVAAGAGNADEVHSLSELNDLLPRADFVVLACPLNDKTRHIINKKSLIKFKEDAYLVNVARGGCVEQSALINALEENRINGAALDCTEEEPLPSSSELWSFSNVLITPHSGGETRKYEQNLIQILATNLGCLFDGKEGLINQVI